MLSKSAFEVASVIVTGGLTAHDLKLSIATEGVAPERVDEFLRDALAELARCGYLVWLYEPNYGNTSPVSPARCDEREFDNYWRLCFPSGGPTSHFPDGDHPTLFLEHNAALLCEVNKPEYGPFLTS
jgi:hypothetical protein